MGLGPLHTVSLAEARAKARECRQLRLEGIDPIDARNAKRAEAKLEAAKTMTFRQCAEAYIAAHAPGWKNAKHAAQWPSTLEDYVYPVFGALPVQVIDVGLVMKVLEPMWQTKPETASRVRGRIEAVLDGAKARGYRNGENPAQWRGHLDKLLPARSKAKRAVRQTAGRGEHLTALPYSDLSAFMSNLRQHDDIEARALEFTILTAARTNEVVGLRWNEIDLDKGVWTVPAARMKAGREHRVPLSNDALALLRALATQGTPPAGRVFPIAPHTQLRFLRRQRDEITVHGFRSSFRDWTADQTRFPREVVEMALAHAISDKVEAAYRRGDLFQKRRDLMEAWARYAAGSEAEVVPLHPPAQSALSA
jgi:integrase